MYGEKGKTHRNLNMAHRKIVNFDRKWPSYNSDEIDIMEEKLAVFDAFHSVNIVESVEETVDQWGG